MKNHNAESKTINSFLKKLMSLTILLIMMSPFLTNAQSGKVNFSGTWVMNAEKSTQPEGGGGMRMGGGNFVAKQEANLLSVDRTRGDQTVTSKYTLDGKESVNTTGRGESKSTATWSADGKNLTIVTTRTFERDGQSTQMKTTEVWTLTSAALLTIVSTSSTPNGERKTTMVYDKK